jgi:hypothetical protein
MLRFCFFLFLLTSSFFFLYAQIEDLDEEVETEDPYQELKFRVEHTKITIDFEDASLLEVLNFIREISSCNIVPSPALSQGDYEDKKVNLKLTDISVKNCLNLLGSLYHLESLYTSGVLFITPKDQVRRKVYLKLYDTRDLVFKIQDFPGPQRILEGEKDKGAVEKNVFNDAEELLNLVRDTVNNDWEQEGHSIAVHGNLIIAVTTKPVHREIEKLLATIRRHK